MNWASHQTVPTACEMHNETIDPSCIPCGRFIRWNSPAIIKYWRGRSRTTINRSPKPCMHHLYTPRATNGCTACEQWAIIEFKSWKRLEAFEKRKAHWQNHENQRLLELEEKRQIETDHIQSLKEARSGSSNSKSKIRSGYVYALENKAFAGWVKFGSAVDLNERLSSYQTADPHRGYRKIYQVFVSNRLIAEQKVLQEAEQCGRRSGEWVEIERLTAKKILRDFRNSLIDIYRAK